MPDAACPRQRPATPLHAARRATVRPGIDVLLEDSSHLVAGKRLGLMTNQAGVDAQGNSTVDRLACWPAARLLALFAPEHGIRGLAPPGRLVADTVDSATGLPIYSLYGANRAPTAMQLESLDVLVVDLQDVGVSTYTYVSTAVLAMRAAAQARKRLLVLDRPNPIGCAVQGPVADSAHLSFIRPLKVPLRHGMTMGELLRLANAELGIGADLVVVPVRGWRRCMWFDQTGLPWIPPSPNLPDLESVAWYPGTVLFEATGLSVGRGTDAPFRQIGAPWLDARRVSRLMASRYGIRLDVVSFTPRSPGDGRYDRVRVRGLRFPPACREELVMREGCGAPHSLRAGSGESGECPGSDPVGDAVLLLRTIAALHPDSLRLDRSALAARLGIEPEERGERAFESFMAARQRFLLYR
jgi:uncharacterized protein YbbC (DUF1343 family)